MYWKMTQKIALCLLVYLPLHTVAAPFGANLCRTDPRFYCLPTTSSYIKKILKNPTFRVMLNQVNRVNVGLSGQIAVPKKFSTEPSSLAPFPERMPAPLHKVVFVDLKQLAWGAYDTMGHLVRWGAISPGKEYCPDEKAGCRTETGKFKVYQKGTASCQSHKYPKPNGGAPMAYCMFFNKGMALHAGKLPGRADSHGCVRIDKPDAAWLNQHFVEVGTHVIVR